jgi:hypothetical protein
MGEAADFAEETGGLAAAVEDVAEVLVGHAKDRGGGAVGPALAFERDFFGIRDHLSFKCSTLNIYESALLS